MRLRFRYILIFLINSIIIKISYLISLKNKKINLKKINKIEFFKKKIGIKKIKNKIKTIYLTI
jgi:flagellar biosynthesis protein FlhB